MPPRFDGFVQMFDNVMSVAISFIGVAAVGMIIFGGYMWMISAGDPQKVQRAQGTITWAVLGTIFILLVRMILEVLIDFLVN